MNSIQQSKKSSGTTKAKEHHHCRTAPKWAALVGDILFPMPRRKLSARAVLDQSGYGDDVTLVRDYGGKHDIFLDDDALVDLGDGNVFKVKPRCESGSSTICSEPPKRAFVCDDQWEVTLIGKQSGKTLRRLFRLPPEVRLYRDFESPIDEEIKDEEPVEFHDGPVFTCRENKTLNGIRIIVNGREKTADSQKASYNDLILLAFGARQTDTIYTIDYKHGPPSNPSGSMVEGDIVELKCRMVFNVTDSGKA